MRRIVWLLLGCLVYCGCSSVPPKSNGSAKSPRAARTQIERGPVKVTVEVAPEPARLSDEPQLTLTIEHESGIEIRKPPFGEAVGNFIVRGFREPLPRSEGNRQVRQQIYTLEPTQAGPSQIDPIVISFVDKRPNGDGQQHQIETEALTVNVVSALDKESPSLAKIKGPQGPVPLPTPTPNLLWWAIGAVAAAVIAVGAWFNYHRPAPEPVLSPRELAERELTSLWKSDVARTEVKEFYVGLTGIVRRYIERTSGIHAPEQTTEEFLRETVAHAAFSRDERQRLREFLEAADLVKFAAHRPLFQDIEESFHRAKLFVGMPATEQPA
jgi:hypothetical protein